MTVFTGVTNTSGESNRNAFSLVLGISFSTSRRVVLSLVFPFFFNIRYGAVYMRGDDNFEAVSEAFEP